MNSDNSSARPVSKQQHIYRIPPNHYIHVLDQNSITTTLHVGPMTYIRQDHEKVVYGPAQMITVPPAHYCVIENPVARDPDGNVITVNGQVKLHYADQEVRLAQDPFALYPGEIMKTEITPLTVVPPNTALRLKALLDVDEADSKRIAGEEWLFEGPGTYVPRKEVTVVETIKAKTMKPGEALKVKAVRNCVDQEGLRRVAGEEWLVKKVGSYLPGAYEEIVSVVKAYTITENTALHLKCVNSFIDVWKNERRNGDEWLVYREDAHTYIPDVNEKVLAIVEKITLTTRQYCVIVDPVGDDGKPQLGRKKLVKGECSFFLMPGETLMNGIEDVYILSEEQGLVLSANERFVDEEVTRNPGDRWVLKGPAEYIPPVEVQVVCERKAIPLDKNEGVYVRNIKTGEVREVIGETYMLNYDEELWDKHVPSSVESVLINKRWLLPGSHTTGRDRSKVISLCLPNNSAVQIYDYRKRKARFASGPDLVLVGPDEQFTRLAFNQWQKFNLILAMLFELLIFKICSIFQNQERL